MPKKNNATLSLNLISFEARLKLKVEKLLEGNSFTVQSAPLIKEVALELNDKILDFYHQLKNQEFDALILLTGVATRSFIKTLSQKFEREEILQTLAKQQIIVRGPKPEKVCQIFKLPILYKVPKPNTWREIVASLKTRHLISGKKIAILHYGKINEEFTQDLTNEGAKYESLLVYRWELPDDLEPVKSAIKKILAGKTNGLIFTSAQQVVHLFELVKQQNCELEFRRALLSTVVFSIGPICSERLIKYQVDVDCEVFPNTLDHLVEVIKEKAASLWLQKQNKFIEKQAVWLNQPLTDPKKIEQNPLNLMLAGKKPQRIPIWLMRQAGRYMAEYQTIRQNTDFVSLCLNPELVAKATLSAIERLGLDAAIIFSDILIVARPMGFSLHYDEGVGPVIDNPLHGPKEFEKIKKENLIQELEPVAQAIQLTRKNLAPQIPLLGFSAAPFTLASYLIEGGSSKHFLKTKKFIHNQPKLWHDLMQFLTEALFDLLVMQIKKGCQLVQVFDSWCGVLDPQDFEKYCYPYLKNLVQKLSQNNIQTIVYGSFSQAQLKQIDVDNITLSLSWQIDLEWAHQKLNKNLAFQGNLDPALLFCKPESFLPKVKNILTILKKRKNSIFNLGHGILPKTPLANVMELIDFVRKEGKLD